MIIAKIRQIKFNNNINRKIIKLEIDIFFQIIIKKQHSTKTIAIAWIEIKIISETFDDKLLKQQQQKCIQQFPIFLLN